MNGLLPIHLSMTWGRSHPDFLLDWSWSQTELFLHALYEMYSAENWEAGHLILNYRGIPIVKVVHSIHGILDGLANQGLFVLNLNVPNIFPSKLPFARRRLIHHSNAVSTSLLRRQMYVYELGWRNWIELEYFLETYVTLATNYSIKIL